LIIGLGLSLHI